MKLPHSTRSWAPSTRSNCNHQKQTAISPHLSFQSSHTLRLSPGLQDACALLAHAGSQRKPLSRHTSLSAHIRAMEPMLLVMVIRVALARSSLLANSRFSLLIMFPKLNRKVCKEIHSTSFGGGGEMPKSSFQGKDNRARAQMDLQSYQVGRGQWAAWSSLPARNIHPRSSRASYSLTFTLHLHMHPRVSWTKIAPHEKGAEPHIEFLWARGRGWWISFKDQKWWYIHIQNQQASLLQKSVMKL